MKYIYIFDYTLNHIYEIAIDVDLFEKEVQKDVEAYLYKHYNMKQTNVEFMVSNYKLEIQRIEKVK